MDTRTVVILVVSAITALLIISTIYSRRRSLIQIGQIDMAYGAPTKSINLSTLFITDIKETVRVYEPHRLLLVGGVLLNFRDILSVSMTKNVANKQGDVTIVSQKSTAGTIGRAALGKLVAGNTGALIGAGTAKTRTKIQSNKDDDEIKYVISITVNSIQHPMVKLEIGDSNKAMETYSLLEVICSHRV